MVEDEPDLLDLTCKFLRMKNYKVYGMAKAEQALVYLEKEHVDLLVSGINLPDLNGYELANIVQEKYPKIPIQLVSGYNEIGDIKAFACFLCHLLSIRKLN